MVSWPGAGFAIVRRRPGVRPADLGLPLHSLDRSIPCASVMLAARRRPVGVPVQLYDIKWPSVRSSFVHLLFT
jgi:hypothetical protein